MSLGAKVSSRYLLAKLANAVECVVKDVTSSGHGAVHPQAGMFQLFKDAYQKQMTTVMAITGAAMAPALNADAVSNKSAFEKLVVRLIPRPSPRTVAVGDVVAFNSPLDPNSTHSVMVRRVAALEGQSMLDSEDTEFVDQVPLGHCWVLADNEALTPPDVIDSRAFGYLDMRLILGRVIYKVKDAQQHGPVTNSPHATAADAAVIEGEVDVEALSEGMPASQQQQPQQKQHPQQQQEQQQEQ